jgi:hypothetical protein
MNGDRIVSVRPQGRLLLIECFGESPHFTGAVLPERAMPGALLPQSFNESPVHPFCLRERI